MEFSSNLECQDPCKT